VITRAKISLLAVALLALAACSKDKSIDPPAKLVDVKASIKVAKLWSTSLGGAEPVLRFGLAPATEGDVVYAAGHGGDVVALKATNGKNLWSAKTRKPIAGGPGVGHGLVVVGTADGEVVALDQGNGTTKWTTFVGGEVLSAPAVAADAVIVRTVGGRLIGLALADGKEIWREDQQIPKLTLRGAATPVVSGNTVFCGFDNGRVLAVQTGNGETVWDALVAPARGRTELERLVDIDSPLKISGTDIFVAGFQGRLAMLSMDNGQAWWSRDLSSYNGVDVDQDRVYVAAANGDVIAFKRRTGIEEWRQEALRNRGLSAPVVIGAYVVVVDFEGVVHWLDANNGKFVARDKAGDRVRQAPLVVGDVVVMQDEKGRLSAFRPQR
jgi:outer membrane protein assembly factor BamB